MIEILNPEQLISIAVQQGLPLSEAEARLLLGYMEGHDYVLVLDEGSRMARHDLQINDDHSENEPYGIVDTIRFACEMNEDILRNAEREREPDAEYLIQLRKDDRMLTELLERFPEGVHV